MLWRVFAANAAVFALAFALLAAQGPHHKHRHTRRRDRPGPPRRHVVDPELVNLLLGRPAIRSRLEDLSPREREVLALLAEGLTDRGISERLWLTPKTVETHIRHILTKLSLPINNHHNRRVLAVLTYLREAAA
jgi:DNA-binding NarL/FixJ family response regulator